jgi:hypothetical protein
MVKLFSVLAHCAVEENGSFTSFAIVSAGKTKGGSITVHQLYDNGQFLFLFAKQTNPN